MTRCGRGEREEARMEGYVMSKVRIVGKIVGVQDKGDMIDLLISEHQGWFSQNGQIQVRLDKQAAIDLHKELTQKKVKMGNIVGLTRQVLEGNEIEILFFV
jgi:hypothetical protein